MWLGMGRGEWECGVWSVEERLAEGGREGGPDNKQ